MIITTKSKNVDKVLS